MDFMVAKGRHELAKIAGRVTIMATQREKAERLRTLHRRGDPVVFINVWDALSARVVESLGFPAIATTSAGVAFVEGFADGEHISREQMLAGVARVVRAVDVPVTADLESAYGTSVEDARATARGAIEAGAVGLNFEDAFRERELRDADEQVARIAAMREIADEMDVPLVINARTDCFFIGNAPGGEWRLQEAIRRGNLYLQAGASSIFVPGVTDEPTIAKLVGGIGGPLNVLAGAASPSVKRLAELGVARISVGSGGIGYAMAQFRRAAQSVQDTGSFAFTAERMPHPEMNALFEH